MAKFSSKIIYVVLIFSLIVFWGFFSGSDDCGAVSAFQTGGYETSNVSGVNNSINVVPIQFGRDSYGLALIDNVNETISLYRINERGAIQDRLELYAARSFKYDRQLEQYNTSEPKPEQIKKMLESVSNKLKKNEKPVTKKVVKEPNQVDEEQLKGW
ncbi:MAG: hypothetical protein H8D47_03710 [Planctomycetes bacterium]|nr:hypothetical protein [Planctomycetota bacterium]